MKAKKLIEVALPIKEISAESVRDKYVHTGHISTLHIWWARRPLPLCRAAIFASLVPDPLDDNCPQAFRDSICDLLNDNMGLLYHMYKPYDDIPYTAIVDPMEDNLRNRLMMFIGRFSDESCVKMMKGESIAQKDFIAEKSLIKCESKNDKEIIRTAQKLIFVAYNSERNDTGYETLSKEFDKLSNDITEAEKELYSIIDRHISKKEVQEAETRLQNAIETFLNNMPSVFDPFAGGGAIPLEAARLGCRSYGNDINPVAHIIERGSAEFPQKYGKPITYSKSEFKKIYGDYGYQMALNDSSIFIDGFNINIPNRLAFDVEFYANRLLDKTKEEYGYLYENFEDNKTPVVYYWARTVKCSNPSCGARVPMLKNFYLAAKKGKQIYLNPIINGNQIDFELKKGTCNITPWNRRGNITCPCCKNIIPISEVKSQSVQEGLTPRLIAIVYDNDGKQYSLPNTQVLEKKLQHDEKDISQSTMHRNSGGGDTFSWGITKWHQLFTNRQLDILTFLADNVREIIKVKNEYDAVVATYLALFVDRVISYSTSFGRWIPQNEQLTSLFGRQAIAMNSDFPEINIFSKSTSGAYNQLEWIIDYLKSESNSPFSAIFKNSSSGEKTQFKSKELTAVVTDPPYYNAIAYADISDFFYIWMKRIIGDLYPLNFATPQTPKADECTALKHHHNGSEEEAKKHFETKLTEIFDAIERQTSDIVSIMFAHQSTEAWTTLCNSILGARMNIVGSWAIDSERDTRMVANSGSALESSVTVACRPSERKGFEEYKNVERAIKEKVKKEVESLYELGFRGADLLTACFGQAVSEFGKYKMVEKANGDVVTVAELLELARQTAFDSLLSGVQADDMTRFYIGWLQMNGMGDTDYDDVTKFTRVGVNVEIKDVFQERLLVGDGNKQHLANAEEHIGASLAQGTKPSHPIIDQVHRAILLNRKESKVDLLRLVKDCAPDAGSQFWRVMASLKELLPAGDDAKQVQNLLQNADYLRQECQKEQQNDQLSLFDLN